MTNIYRGIGWLSLTGITIIGLEMLSPGFTWLTLQVIARMSWLIAQAAVWPLAAFALIWFGWGIGYNSGRREAYQRVASKAGRP